MPSINQAANKALHVTLCLFPLADDSYFAFRLSLDKEAQEVFKQTRSDEKRGISLPVLLRAAMQDYGWVPGELQQSVEGQLNGVFSIMEWQKKASIGQIATAIENAWYRVCNETVSLTKARRDFFKACISAEGRKRKVPYELHVQIETNEADIAQIKQCLMSSSELPSFIKKKMGHAGP